jgi:hypothetical protein
VSSRLIKEVRDLPRKVSGVRSCDRCGQDRDAQDRDADGPDRDVHRHAPERFRPSPAERMRCGKQDVRHERDEQDSDRQTPVVGNRTSTVATEPREHEHPQHRGVDDRERPQPGRYRVSGSTSSCVEHRPACEECYRPGNPSRTVRRKAPSIRLRTGGSGLVTDHLWWQWSHSYTTVRWWLLISTARASPFPSMQPGQIGDSAERSAVTVTSCTGP